MNIIEWNDCQNQIIDSLRNQTLLPILGSGFSFGTKTSNKGIVPNGGELKKHMLSEISESGKLSPEDLAKIELKAFRDVCTYYETDHLVPKEQRKIYWKRNFLDASFGNNDPRKKLLDITWPYIYTLNIDDSIENSSNYNTVIVPKRTIDNDIFKEKKCVIKLHGDIAELMKYTDGVKVFTSKEYVDSLSSNRPLLNKLKTDYSNNNIIYIGCSLDDELDLLLVKSLLIQFEKKESETRIYYCTTQKPSSLTIINLESYGITDVIVFKEHKEIYDNLYSAWEKASSIQESQLSSYKSYKIVSLGSGEKDRKTNMSYFLWAKIPTDIKKGTVTIPYYFVKRHEVNSLISQLNKHILHIISGTSFSGLTSILVSIYSRIKNRKVFLFDCLAKLSDSTLNELFNQENTVFLFDNGVVSRKQMGMVLDRLADNISKNNDIIIVDNSNHLAGLIDIYTRENKIDENQYNIYKRYYGKLSKFERKEINDRLAAVNIPVYTPTTNTFLDHLSYVQNELRVRGKYDNVHPKCSTIEELAVLIALAVKHVLYSSDINELSLSSEIVQTINQCKPFIEKVDTLRYERDPSEMSRVKYICNSSYWLNRELSEYLRVNGPSLIVEAYYYLIGQILMDVSVSTEARDKYRNYIEFDNIYNIFKPHESDNYQLGRDIYEKLHPLLSRDFHFMHQKAKCYYRSALKEDNCDVHLKTALNSIVMAKSLVLSEMGESASPFLQITYDHILFTNASIMCEIVKRERYTSIESLEKAIDLVLEAITSNNNTREIKDNMSIASHSISSLINDIIINGVLRDASSKIRDKANQIMTMIARAK